VLILTNLVVEPSWRGKGVGVVLLGVIPQLLQTSLTFGTCAPDTAAFHQRAGFTVLDPGEPFPFPFSKQATIITNSNPTYTCWFYR
jgi:GNAT superfamily N-acetyltransferase